MSDALEKTAAGATRGLLGSYSFILVMLGLEMWTSEHGTRFGLGLFLLVFGGLLAYAAFFWETAKKVLSVEAQRAIGHFAQGRATWAFVIFLVLQALIFAPFIEQHRWPFSYRAGDKEFGEITDLKRQISTLRPMAEHATSWRFVNQIWDANSSRIACHYQLDTTSNASSTRPFWTSLLRAAGWLNDGRAPTNSSVIQPGITLRISDESSSCASYLQRALTDYFPNPPSKVVTNQQVSCGKDCVIIEMDY